MKYFLFSFALIILTQACTKSNSSSSGSERELINDTLSVRYDFGSEFNNNGYTIKTNSSDSFIPVIHDCFTDSSKKGYDTTSLRPYHVLFRDEDGGCYSKPQFIPYNEEHVTSIFDKPYIFLQYRY